MGIFFDYGCVHRRDYFGDPLHCLGCILTDQLDMEQDHYKGVKNTIITHWLYNKETDENGDIKGWNRDNIKQAFEDYHIRDIKAEAKELDSTRYTHRTFGANENERYYTIAGTDPYDRETEERQRPDAAATLTGKMGNRFRSPFVKEPLPDLTDPFSYIRKNRYMGHAQVPL